MWSSFVTIRAKKQNSGEKGQFCIFLFTVSSSFIIPLKYRWLIALNISVLDKFLDTRPLAEKAKKMSE